MDAECVKLRRRSRMLKRRQYKTKPLTDKQAWVEHDRLQHRVYRDKEAAFWNRQCT